MGKLLFLPVLLVLMLGSAFAGTVQITSPNGGEYFKENSVAFDFNVSGYSSGETALLYFDTDTSSPSTYIDALALNGVSCDDNNLLDNTACHYTWNTTSVPDGQYYLKAITISDSIQDYSDAPFWIDKSVPVISNPNPGDMDWFNPDEMALEIDLNDNHSGISISTIDFDFNGTDYNTQNPRLTFNPSSGKLDFNASGIALVEGATYDVNVDVNDLAGNAALRYSYRVRFDSMNPGASVIDATMGDTWAPLDSVTVGCNDLGGSPCKGTMLYLFTNDSILANCPASKDAYIYSTNTGSITVATDSNLYICLWVEDEAGNHDRDISGKSLKVDANAPILGDNHSAGWKNAPQIVTLSCHDSGLFDVNVSGCAQIGWDANAAFSSMPADPQAGLSSNDSNLSTLTKGLNFNLDGAFSVDYNAIDRAGNFSAGTSFEMFIDMTPPEAADINIASFDGTAYVMDGMGYTNDTTPELFLFASDAMSGMSTMQFSCDGSDYGAAIPYAPSYAEFNIASGANGCGIADGNRAVYAKFWDMAGNYSVASGWIYLDRAAPVTTSDANAGWQTFDANVQLACADAGGCYTTQYSLDGDAAAGTSMGAWAPYVTGIVFGADGNFALDYNSTDLAGNIEATNTNYVLVDKTAPSTGISPTAWQKANFSIAIACDDGNGSGCKETKYRVDTDPSSAVSYFDGNFHDYNSLAPPTVAIDGNYAVEYYSTDNVGRNEAAKTGYVLLDKAPPAPFTSSNPLAADADSVRIDWNASTDALSGMQGYGIFRSSSDDLANWALIGTTTDLNFTDDNSGLGLAKDTNYAYCYKIGAFDNANNDTNSAYSCTWLETIPPIMVSLSASVSGSNVTLSYSATDTNGSGVKNYWVRKNEDAWIYVSGTSYIFAGLPNGDYNFFAKAADNADHNSNDANTSAKVSVSSGTPGDSSSGSGSYGGGGGSYGGGGASPAPQNTSSDANSSLTDANTYPSTSGASRIPIDTTKPTVPSGVSDTAAAGEEEPQESPPSSPSGLFSFFNEYMGLLGLIAVLAIAAIVILLGRTAKENGSGPEEENAPPAKKWEYRKEKEK